VAAICAKLDGLPLAIELAAARSRHLPPAALLKRLESSLALLTGGPRNLPHRQQTLHETIAWSYALLDDHGQVLFRRVSVFTGGCSVEAVEAVCRTPEGLPGLEGDVLAGLAALADQSLLVVDEGPEGEPWFRLLETVRAFGREKLVEAGELVVMASAHASWCLALAEQAAAMRHGPHQARWLNYLDQEQENLRTALAWYLGEDARSRSAAEDRVERGLRLVSAMIDFWFVRSRRREGLRWLRAALDQSRDLRSLIRVRALHTAAGMAWNTGDRARGLAFGDEAVALCRSLGDPFSLARALNQHGGFLRGDWCGETWNPRTYAQGTALVEEGVRLAREMGDSWLLSFSLMSLAASTDLQREDERMQAWAAAQESLLLYQQREDLQGVGQAHRVLGWLALAEHDYARAQAELRVALAALQEFGEPAGVAWVLSYRGDAARGLADLTEARACYEESLALYRTLDFDREHMARALCRLGDLALMQDDRSLARASYVESLRVARDGGALGRVAAALEALASLGVVHQQMERALLLAAAASAWRESGQQPLSHAEQTVLTAKLAPAYQALSPLEQAAAWTIGRELTLEEAVATAMDESSPPRGAVQAHVKGCAADGNRPKSGAVATVPYKGEADDQA
jgi:tetratricopeptide (TPR) repeat protein